MDKQLIQQANRQHANKLVYTDI